MEKYTQNQMLRPHRYTTKDEPVRRTGGDDGFGLRGVGVFALDFFGLGADCVLDVLRG